MDVEQREKEMRVNRSFSCSLGESLFQPFQLICVVPSHFKSAYTESIIASRFVLSRHEDRDENG